MKSLIAATTLALIAWVAPTVTSSANPGHEAKSAIPQVDCGPGSRPETGLQGQVPRRDRDSGRSQHGYSCNMKLIGQYQGQGATWVQPSYEHCSYIGSFFPGPLLQKDPGVHVVDVSDPAHPRFTENLNSTAMSLGTWESLKVDPVHGRLAATGVPLPPGVGALTFDIYDIKTDCAHPRLLNGHHGTMTTPTLVLGHEGLFSPDGNTYYAMNAIGQITAIDLSNPAQPRTIAVLTGGFTNHGASISPDGRTMYGVTAVPSGMTVLDISDIQDRRPFPGVRQIGQLTWPGWLSQHTINFTSKGRRLLFAVDEGAGGGVRLIDIANPRKPKQLREYRLEINEPSNAAVAARDLGGNGVFGYDSHYCNIDKLVDPTMLACGYFDSGVRLFDIRDPLRPKELAYYNPPAQAAKKAQLVNSPHAYFHVIPPVIDYNMFTVDTLANSFRPDLKTDWCTSPPQFRPGNRLWITCTDNGFQVLEYSLPG